MQPNIFRRVLVSVPPRSTLPQDTLDRLEAAQQALPAIAPQRVYRGPVPRKRLIGLLSHELADRMAELSAGRTPSPDRSDLECAALALLDPVVMSLPGGFVAALEAPRQAMGLADNALRRGDIALLPQEAAIAAEIDAMPMGYESLVGDMGSSLSGGQRQRVLIARALYGEVTTGVTLNNVWALMVVQ